MAVENSTNIKNIENRPKQVPTDRDGAFIIIFIMISFVLQTLIVALISSIY